MDKAVQPPSSYKKAKPIATVIPLTEKAEAPRPLHPHLNAQDD